MNIGFGGTNLLGLGHRRDMFRVNNEAENSTNSDEKSESKECVLGNGATSVSNPDSPGEDTGQQKKRNSKDLEHQWAY